MPPFRLRNVLQVLGLSHDSAAESTLGVGPGNARTMSAQSSAGYDRQIQAWAAAAGKTVSAAEFAARLDGSQISDELIQQFREQPEFGRSLAERLDPLLRDAAFGSLLLIDAGGEAVVFGDSLHQRVIKFFAPPNMGRFGWVLDREPNGRWGIRGGALAEAVLRFAWFEACFVSGLELDFIGSRGDFLTLSQPFFVGHRPDEAELADWMHENGWEPWEPPTDQDTVLRHTWRRDDFAATDVLPRNAIATEADGRIRAIDFIVTRLS